CMCCSCHRRWLHSFPTRRSSDLLLWNGRLPDARQLDELNSRLYAERGLPRTVVDMIRLMPRDANPMAALRTAVSALALEDPEAEDRKSTRLNSSHVKISYAVFCL